MAVELTLNNNITDALNKYGTTLISELTAQLMAAGKGSKLSQTLKTEVISAVTELRLQLEAAEYLTYVDQGRAAGKMPPPSEIEQWMSQKGITPKNGNIEEAAFGIALNIGRYGIKPTNVIQNSILKTQSTLEANIKNSIEQFVKDALIYSQQLPNTQINNQ